jgi:hyperosmotically inducible protein
MLAARIANWSGCIVVTLLLLSSCERKSAGNILSTTRGGGAQATLAFSDSAIHQAVLRALREGPGLDASCVVVKTKGGIVELGGEVDTLFAKGRAVGLARSVKGVRAVNDHVSVRVEPRPDNDLTRDVSRALLQIDAATPSSIAARASDGIVTLTGCVRSHQEHEIADRIAEAVRGVRKVRNQLTLADAGRKERCN